MRLRYRRACQGQSIACLTERTWLAVWLHPSGKVQGLSGGLSCCQRLPPQPIELLRQLLLRGQEVPALRMQRLLSARCQQQAVLHQIQYFIRSLRNYRCAPGATRCVRTA